MTPLYAAAQIRSLECGLAAVSPRPLMQLAGEAAAGLALTLAGDADVGFVCVAGPGNNGGDALVAAEVLRAAGHKVWLIAPWQERINQLEMPAQKAFTAFVKAGARAVDTWPKAAAPTLVVVDGLLGTGANRAPAGTMLHWLERINAARQSGAKVLALDVPSGLDADTGHAPGAVVQATHTACFVAPKPGLYTGRGPGCTGEIVNLPLWDGPAWRAPGQGATVSLAAPTPQAWLLLPKHHAQLGLPRRAALAHKGCHGTLAVIGGANGMAGAPVLAGRAALTLGAGKVRVGFVGAAPLCDAAMPELMLGPARGALEAATAAVIGPGMGQRARAASVLRAALASDLPLVLDADALNLIAGKPQRAAQTSARPAATIMTPHALEAARLLGLATRAVQADRLAAAQALAQRFNAVVVLKGAGTVVAAPGRAPVINGSGNAALATAGTGDVLAGMIGAMLARGVPAFEAACLAVSLHGAAADRYRARAGGLEGLTASAVAALAAELTNLC